MVLLQMAPKQYVSFPLSLKGSFKCEYILQGDRLVIRCCSECTNNSTPWVHFGVALDFPQQENKVMKIKEMQRAKIVCRCAAPSSPRDNYHCL